MRILILILTLSILPGCETLKNYEFGDITKKIVEMKKNYCSEKNLKVRAAILLTIHAIDPYWVPVCVILKPDSGF